MTEGIIQKVFKKYEIYPRESHTGKELFRLKLELIAEIRNQCASTDLHNHWLSIKQLIGDMI